MRVLVYLEDTGEAKSIPKPSQSLAQARQMKGQSSAAGLASAFQVQNSPDGLTGDPQAEYQAVWQLEMWKRAEEAKFKAYLK